MGLQILPGMSSTRANPPHPDTPQRLLGHLRTLSVRLSSIRYLDDTITAFLAQYDNPETIRTYQKVLLPFANEFHPRQRLGTISPEILDGWLYQLRKRNLAQATIASRVRIMKTFWNWCFRRHYVTQNPARFLVVKRPKRHLISKAIPHPVLLAMFEAVQQKACPFLALRDTAILALLMTYGSRASDVTRLTLNMIQLENQRILFRVKGSQDLLLPLPAQTQQHLVARLSLRAACKPDPPHEYVFVNNHTRPDHRHAPLAARSISTLVNRLSAQVGGQVYGPHAIRHWRGQSLADQRVPPTIVQAILGHQHIRTTLEHYYNQDWDRVEHTLQTYELGRIIDVTQFSASRAAGAVVGLRPW